MRVWVTRTRPGAEATADRLRALGHEPLVAPVLEVRLLDGAGMDLAGVGALAFTSVHAVAAFAALTPLRDPPVFAVGETTAAAATAAGFVRVDSADGDVEALARLIIAARPESILHPAALEPAGDLVATLSDAGIAARRIALYETVAVAALPPVVEAALADGGLDAVLAHSPKAAGAVARLLAGRPLGALDAFALSAACAAPLAACGFRRLGVAAAPNEAALLALPGLAPAEAGRPPARMMGPVFWALLVFGLMCVIVGAAVAAWGPRLFPAGPDEGRPQASAPDQ